MPDTNDNDIEELFCLLDHVIGGQRHRAALTALVAERNALKQRVAELEALPSKPFVATTMEIEEAMQRALKREKELPYIVQVCPSDWDIVVMAREIMRLRNEVERLRAELAAMRQQRDEARGQTLYLLYDGTSVDGRGEGKYIGRTTDKEVARNHHAKCRKNPYSIGFVEIVTDTEKKQVSYYGRELQPEKEGGGA